MLQKNPSKNPNYEKVKKFKKFKKAHLWLSPLSLLTHLIVIAPHVD
jgi:hypothetical protein